MYAASDGVQRTGLVAGGRYALTRLSWDLFKCTLEQWPLSVVHYSAVLAQQVVQVEHQRSEATLVGKTRDTREGETAGSNPSPLAH
jgi:hypothetical protein